MYRSEVSDVLQKRNGPQHCSSTFCNVSCNSSEIQNATAHRSGAELYLQRGRGVRQEHGYEWIFLF